MWYIQIVINEQRQKLDITIAELAEAIGYTKSGASLIANGERACPRFVAEKIALILNSTTRKLFKKESDRDWYKVKVKK